MGYVIDRVHIQYPEQDIKVMLWITKAMVKGREFYSGNTDVSGRAQIAALESQVRRVYLDEYKGKL